MGFSSTSVPVSRGGVHRVPRLVAHVALVVGAVIMIYPLVWMLSSSVKPAEEIFTDISLLPRHLTLANYLDGWSGLELPFGRYFLNSLLVCAGAIVGNLVGCSMAAYAFARLRFRFRNLWFALMMATIMLPSHVTLIPQYALFNSIGWTNSYLPLIVPKLLATESFFIFLIVQFIRGLPRELDDAAKIDGCGPPGIYWRIILPLLRPALVTTTIFTFIWTYNDFFSQLIYLSDSRLFTVPLALSLFLDMTGESAWGPMFAMSVLSLIPVLVFFVVFQRMIIEGISTSGLRS
ncbi:carbohydrate ABC transporter permease [Actinopolymorpha pittospori]|uniref:Multiple sugar transport system permease protein n=1 Tax=Actinopolymorpha pittospori TaxID=648752 RepID=A0A927N0Y4_9ACTN|nr:multiple sugar transport system permease protein [Actinopolymorpha pittospori]